MSKTLLSLSFFSLLTACIGGGSAKDDTAVDSTPPIPEGDDVAARLTGSGGCSDILLYAYAPDGSLLLKLLGTDLIAATYDGADEETVYTLPDAALSVTLDEGIGLNEVACNDVSTGDAVVKHSYDAVAGTVTLTITPTADDYEETSRPAFADALVEGLVVQEAGTGDAYEVSTLEITAGVGWYPG